MPSELERWFEELQVQVKDIYRRLDRLQTLENAMATDTIWDAKGDLAGGTGANTAARLAVGTDNYILMAASGEATGLKWSNIETIPWTNYSPDSTYVGWSSWTSKTIFYKRVGDLVYVTYIISGTSNSTLTSFTLPYSYNGGHTKIIAIVVADNGAYDIGRAQFTNGLSKVDFYRNATGNVWTASGTKLVTGEFWYYTTQAP